MPPITRKTNVSAADWKEEYDELEQDVEERERPSEIRESETDEAPEIPNPEMNMSQLLRHAKVKGEKLQSGYDFIVSPAAKVVVPDEQKPTPGTKEEDEEWVDLKEDEGRKGYSEVVKSS